MRFSVSDVWKIGWANNAAERRDQINKHIPVEILDVQWELEITQDWNSAQLALDMEQRVLKILECKRTQGERVQCSEAELKAAWFKGRSG